MSDTVSALSRPATRGSIAAAAAAHSAAEPASMAYDAVVDLSLPELNNRLSDGTAADLRGLRSYLGLGSSGTKAENQVLIYDHIEKQHHLKAGLQPVDSLVASDPWKAYKKKSENTTAVKDHGKPDVKKQHFDKARGNI